MDTEMRDELQAAWEEYCKLRAEGYKLFAEADKYFADGLYAKGYKINAEGGNLCDKGRALWNKKIFDICGNMVAYDKYDNAELSYHDGGCYVLGEFFRH